MPTAGPFMRDPANTRLQTVGITQPTNLVAAMVLTLKCVWEVICISSVGP